MIWKYSSKNLNSLLHGVVSGFFIGIIKAYQIWLRPYFHTGCYFYPSCSEYAKLQLEKKGGLKFLPVIVGRLLRCHPLAKRESSSLIIDLP